MSLKQIAVGAASSLIGAGIENAFGRSNMARQHQYSKDLLDYQWNNQTPAVVNSLRKAGLNPGLMYSNGGPSVGSSTGSTSVPHISNPLLGVGDLYNASRLADSDIALKDAQSNNLRVDSLLKEKKTVTEELDQQQKRLDLAKTDDERREIQSRIDVNQKRLEQIDNEIKNSNKLTDSTVKLQDSQSSLNEAERQRIIEVLPLEREHKQTLIDLNKANESGVYKENEVRQSLIVLRELEGKKIDEETRSIVQDVISKQFENWYRSVYGTNPSTGVNAVIDWIFRRAAGAKDNGHDFGERGAFGQIKEFWTKSVPQQIIRDLKLSYEEANRLSYRIKLWFNDVMP